MSSCTDAVVEDERLTLGGGGQCCHGTRRVKRKQAFVGVVTDEISIGVETHPVGTTVCVREVFHAGAVGPKANDAAAFQACVEHPVRAECE